MILADEMLRHQNGNSVVENLKIAYRAMTPEETPPELARIAARIGRVPSPRSEGPKVALVAQRDPSHRELATALLEETDLAVMECASAEAALAILVNQADRTVFLLADRELSGAQDVEALARVVRVLWPGIHVAIASQAEEAGRHIDGSGIVRLSRPWRGLDVLVEAEHALARAA